MFGFGLSAYLALSTAMANPRCLQQELEVCLFQPKSYSQEVAIIKPPRGAVRDLPVSVFLHGFSFGTDRDRDLEAVLKDLRLVQTLHAAAQPRWVLIPWSSGRNQSYRTELTDFASLRRLVDEAAGQFGIVVPNRFEVWAHSGAYKTVTDVLVGSGDQISSVTFLDATYGSLDVPVISDWFNRGQRSLSVFYLKDSPTQKGAVGLQNAIVPQPKFWVVEVPPKSVDHWSLVPKGLEALLAR